MEFKKQQGQQVDKNDFRTQKEKRNINEVEK
jgi:hypothetical protein